MTQQKWLAVACLAVVTACGPAMVEPVLEVTAAPRSIRADGQTSVLSITATDGTGKPGTGSVRVRSTFGSLKDAATVQLAAGKGEVDFSCDVRLDAECRGTARLTAEWTSGGKLIETTASITLTAAQIDAGVDAGMPVVDAGAGDAGSGDGGSDDAGMAVDAGDVLPPGTFDGGFYNQYRLTIIDIEKPTLLTGVSDELDITFQLTLNTTFMNPVAGRMATLTVDNGASFSGTMPAPAITRMTDMAGRFTVTVYSGNASPRSTLSVVANAEDARATAVLRAVNIASAEWVDDTMTQRTLAVSSTGMGNTTPVLFRVKDAMGMPVEGVDVSFLIAPNSAAGCTLLPLRDRTNAMGIARTTLSSGDSQGTASVLARVFSLPDTLSTNFNIVIGRVNEGRMQLSCDRTTLGARQAAQPPRIDQSAICTVSLVDRGGRNPPFALNVSWLTEAGSIPPMSTSMPGATSVSATFNTGGALPVPTTPLPAVGGPFPAPAEPSSGLNNPRDNFVAIVAAVQGEEEFWDGSGAANGITNGSWEPGEYWVDLAEPFADNNDNGRWDPGEPYIDTDRTNCATGLVEPKNNRWDPPNGCWDRATQVWKTTHIVYSGGPAAGSGAVGTFIRFSPAIPSFMAPDTVQQINITWTDEWFNRFSSDGASVSVTSVAGSRGTATIANGTIAGEDFGHRLEYLAIRAQVSDAGTIIAEEGLCDEQEPDSGYPDVRCLRTYRFRDWRTSSPAVTMTLVAPTPQTPLMDGGVPPATNTTWELRSANSLQSGPSAYQFTVSFP
ncbi:MAG: Ig-like domain-containing protein [Myxococcales bacterium]|nr:Ig-like domain-containing protein [Myxococcales bacterium]